MPFADFLTQVGGGSALGRVGRALGGTTEQEQVRKNFVEKTLNPFIEGLKAADSEEKVLDFANRNLRPLLAEGVKVGIKPEKLEKLTDTFMGPAMENLRRGEIGRIAGETGPQTTPLTPQVAPEGQGQPFDLGTSFTPQTTPGRDFTQADALSIAKYGKFPEGLAGGLEVPSKVLENVAQTRSHAATGAQKEYDLGQQRRLENIQLPGSAGEAGMTAGMLSAGGAPVASYFTGLNPQRERPADPLEDVKRRHLEALTERATRPTAGPQPARGSTEMQDYVAMGGDPNDRQGFMDYVAERRGRESETSIHTPPSGFNLEATLSGIAKDAYAQGKTTPQDIKDFALSRNVVLEGEPKIEGGRFGDKSLSGVTGVSGRPKVVTKGKPGKPPTGQPPTGGAPEAPKVPPNGTKGKSNSGRPMTVVNGQWRYD